MTNERDASEEGKKRKKHNIDRHAVRGEKKKMVATRRNYLKLMRMIGEGLGSRGAHSMHKRALAPLLLLSIL